MQDVVVFGGSGYSGMELLRLLAGHPAVSLRGASSNRWGGEVLSAHVPSWVGDDRFFPHDDLFEVTESGDIAFMATPAGTSLVLGPKLLARGARVIDLSGAFRLADAKAYADWYALEHDRADLLRDAIYGLPELFPDGFGEAKLIANPGCYATAAILAVAPLVKANLLQPGAPIVLDGKSGATGAGRKLADNLLFNEVAETVKPYRLGAHQHTPEIERYLGLLGGDVKVSFTAHLLSIRRGLLVSAYAPARQGVDQAAIDAAYDELYSEAKFVRVLRDRIPHPGAVVYTNHCDVRAQLDPRTHMIMAFGALDNLVKGAAGQAIQNLNALLGIDLTSGLLSTRAS